LDLDIWENDVPLTRHWNRALSAPRRTLLSSADAPKIRNRFMKLVLDKGNFFKPGAPRWAFAFMGRKAHG
jgi:hypothetical protein